MPQPGQRSISIPEYTWERAKRYFEEHKAELRKRGIKSVSKLISVWVDEAALEAK